MFPSVGLKTYVKNVWVTKLNRTKKTSLINEKDDDFQGLTIFKHMQKSQGEYWMVNEEEGIAKEKHLQNKRAPVYQCRARTQD